MHNIAYLGPLVGGQRPGACRPVREEDLSAFLSDRSSRPPTAPRPSHRQGAGPAASSTERMTECLSLQGNVRLFSFKGPEKWQPDTSVQDGPIHLSLSKETEVLEESKPARSSSFFHHVIP
ncbi:hypothetical protein SKAU_G00004490 [Synaphobranchus kaupii]|uniref:Uncharacterized protein n=1 Tax=Synaphobranchus kaupii TaxID=118154 RepID=A0A9Q1GA04_SYNKA|nr:hypothetical protein SKAU_G00004490 [Synaphobranchus kaupii]